MCSCLQELISLISRTISSQSCVAAVAQSSASRFAATPLFPDGPLQRVRPPASSFLPLVSGIRFTATGLPVRRSSARYTLPLLPWPISTMLSNSASGSSLSDSWPSRLVRSACSARADGPLRVPCGLTSGAVSAAAPVKAVKPFVADAAMANAAAAPAPRVQAGQPSEPGTP